MRVWFALAVLTAALLATLPASAQPAEAEAGMLGIRLLEAPVNRADDPRARIYIVDHLAPGATIERRVEVSSTIGAPATVAVYAGAATIEDGVFTGTERGVGNELTEWTSVDTREVVLSQGEAREVNLTIRVPVDAAPGEHYGAIWAETAVNGAAGLAAATRVGIRMYLSVGPGGEPPSSMQIRSLTAGRDPAGVPQVSAEVINDGGRALDVTGTLTLTEGPGGLAGGPFSTTSPTTLQPGQRGRVVVLLDSDLPAGPWKAHLDLSSGRTRAQASATVTFPAAAATDARPVAPDPVPDLLWLVLPIVGALLLLLLWLLVLLARTRTRRRGRASSQGKRARRRMSAEELRGRHRAAT